MSKLTIRSFFACELTGKNLFKIDQLLMQLKTSLPDSVKWVKPENMHLTIKFIGKFNPAHLPRIQTSLTKSLQTFHPFNLEIKRMGVFPSYLKPKVIWLGINAEQSLTQLVNVVNDANQKLGYPREKRPLSAHVTLGRVKSSASQNELRIIGDEIKARESIEIGGQSVDSLHFFQSDLTPKGPVYKVLFTIPFSEQGTSMLKLSGNLHD